VRLSANLAVPSGVSSPNNWDCHIHSFPWMNADVGVLGAWSANASGVGGLNYGSFQPNSVTDNCCPYGNIGVCSVPAGTKTWDSSYTSAANVVAFPLQQQLAPYLTGDYRIIAKGYEVINTTSDLNVQGLVTVYRSPFPDTDSAKTTLVYLNQTGTPTRLNFGYPSVVLDYQIPNNSGSALLLDGSKQWKAKEGVYITDTLNSQEIPPGIDMACVALNLATTDSQYNSSTATAALIGVGTTDLTSIPNTSPTNVLWGYSADGILPTKFNHSGAYFTGLSYSTTLTLNAIFYIEKFPSALDTALVVLAKHSCRSDPIARDLYTEIIREMPVGVPQRMNGLGEWFADAVSSAADFVQPVLSAIPTPMTQGLGSIVKAAGNIAKGINSKSEAPNKYSATGVTGAPAKAVKALVKKEVAVVEKSKKKKNKVKKK